MSNIAPEHGKTPPSPTRTGPGLPSGGGSRPPKPSDNYGTVSAEGPENVSQLFDPNDSDNDMDSDTAGEYGN